MKAVQTIVALSFVVCGAASASGQTPSAPPPAREGKAEFALVTTSGNAASQSLGTAAEITLRPPSWVVAGKVAFVRQEAAGVVSAKSLASLERISRVLTTRLQTFAQHAYLQDLFAGIEHRNLVEGGLSYLVVQAGRNTLFGDAGLGYLNEQRTNRERTTRQELSTPVATAGTRYRLRISETSDLTDDLLASFDIDEDGTWRLSHAIALTARIAGIFSLKLSNQLRFVDEPVPGFEQTDTITSAALVLGF